MRATLIPLLTLPALAQAEPRTSACEVYAEADTYEWPASSTCGKLLPPPEPAAEGEDGEEAASAETVCPIACQVLAPQPAAEPGESEEGAEPAEAYCGADVALCIPPKANPAHKGDSVDLSLFRKPDQEDSAPPTPPPPLSHKPGLTHVFDWVKALNTCRTQTAAAIPRPEKPRKNEFESSDSFGKRQQAYADCQSEREEEVIDRQALIEPVLEEATFYAILRADNIGSYNADEGCFFPGVTARVELDDFKSKDAVYLNHYAAETAATPIDDPKRRLIPRDAELRVELTSDTIARVELDPDSERTVLKLTSHPVCVDAATGREYREQMELNGIADFGIQAELTLRFRFAVGPNPSDPRETVAWPVWVVAGDFVYRNDPDGTVLSVQADRKPPASAESEHGGINVSDGSTCSAVSATGGLMLALVGLWGRRKREG